MDKVRNNIVLSRKAVLMDQTSSSEEIKQKYAEGNVTMTIDPKCKYLIKDLEQVQRDKKGGIDKSNMELTHSLDACSYAIAYKFPVISKASRTMKW